MARMTIKEAQAVWNAQRPVGAPENWPSRALMRKWVDDKRIKVEKVPMGKRQNGETIYLTVILDENPPPQKTQRRARKPKQAALPLTEQSSAPVAGFARAPRRRWPF